MKKCLKLITLLCSISLLGMSMHCAAAATEETMEAFDGIAFVQAALTGDYDEVLRLLELPDADVNATSEFGDSALEMAAYGGHPDIVELLLQAGAEKGTAAKKARDGRFDEMAAMIEHYGESQIKSAGKR